jgi:hypothetical protein
MRSEQTLLFAVLRDQGGSYFIEFAIVGAPEWRKTQ